MPRRTRILGRFFLFLNCERPTFMVCHSKRCARGGGGGGRFSPREGGGGSTSGGNVPCATGSCTPPKSFADSNNDGVGDLKGHYFERWRYPARTWE